MMKYLLILSFIFSSGLTFAQSNGCMTKYDSKQDREIYVMAEVMPSFPGGETSLIEYLEENFKCNELPEVQGTIWVSFIVEEDGSISHSKIVHKLHPDLDAKALEVLSKMPNWKKGSCNNIVVPVEMMIPFKTSY